jgi:hypothetical protein
MKIDVGALRAERGPTLTCEALGECLGLTVVAETVRRFMTDAGLWMSRK